MRLRCGAVATALFAAALLNDCNGGEAVAKDSEVRTYIRDELEPYLDSLAYQLCHVKSRAAPDAPGRLICPGPPEGYQKSPGNGQP